MTITRKRVHETIGYQEGYLVWLPRLGSNVQVIEWNHRHAGRRVEINDKGMINDPSGKSISAVLCSWLLHGGVDPGEAFRVRPIDGDYTNVKIENLRFEHRYFPDPDRGFPPGVYETDVGLFVRIVRENGVTTRIGAFETPEEAAAALFPAGG